MNPETIKTNKYIGYKLFKVKASRPGEIFPLYVNADKPTPIGVWVDADGIVRSGQGDGMTLENYIKWINGDLPISLI